MAQAFPRAVLISALGLSMVPGHVRAGAPFGAVAPVSEGELAAARGMFLAPDGTEIALTIQMDTLVDGNLVLRSVLTPFESGPERLQLYTQRAGTAAAPMGEEIAAAPAPLEGVAFTFDRTAGLTMVAGPEAAPQVQVAVNGTMNAPDATGLDRLTLDGNGMATSAAGSISVMENAQGPVVTLAADTLLVKHVLGAAVANIVANTADNRVIESATVVNLSLGNAAPLIAGASLFAVDDAVLSLAQRPVN